MSVKSKILGWFSRKSKAITTLEKGSIGNLNGLYVPNQSDIKKLTNKVNEIEDALNNLPPPPTIPPAPNLTDYAKKNENNDFVTQAIKDNAAYVAFKKLDNSRKGYVGVVSGNSNDISVVAETNSLILQAKHNINLNAGNGYAATYNPAPTANNHIANKKYVDDRINAIPPVDLSNVAKKNEENAFSQMQTFNGGIDVRGPLVALNNTETVITNKISYANGDYLPTENGELASKKYVDRKTFNKYGDSFQGYCQLNKADYDNVVGTKSYRVINKTITINENVPDGSYTFIFRNFKLYTLQGGRPDAESNPLDTLTNAVVTSFGVRNNQFTMNDVIFFTLFDALPGNTGQFEGYISFDFILF